MTQVEICFAGSLCMPRAEWAMWWQGIGTVLAVFAAIAVVWHQHDLRRREGLDAERRAARMCMQFGLALRESLEKLVQGCRLQNREWVRTQRQILLDVRKWPDGIAVHRLAPEGVAAFLRLRTQGAEAIAQADEMSAITVSLKAWEGTFEKLRDAISWDLVQLARALGEPAPPVMEIAAYENEAEDTPSKAA